MIETIYSNENGDADRTSKAQPAFKMPKNIRQIGKSNAGKRIYVEDYVMSFIKQLAGGEYSQCCIAVLVGQCVKLDNGRNIFISGAVKINDTDTSSDIVFTNETWTSIYEDIKKYFVNEEIVGWFIGGPGYLLSEDDKILKTHIDNFAGQDKVLLTYDNLEKEETFLCYENNRLTKQEGYYIYYEKNDEMQTYIIDHKKEGSCEADYEDKVSKDIRNVIQNKKEEQEDSKSVTRLMYAAGTLLAVIVLIIGAAMLRNYDQMKSMQNTLNTLTRNMEEVLSNHPVTEPSAQEQDITDNSQKDEASVTKGAITDAPVAEEDNSLDVEVEKGNVNPIKDSESQSSKKENNKDGTVSDKELANNQSDSNKVSTPAKNTSKPSSNKKTTSSTNTSKTKTSYYTVKDGDTLADISYKLYHTYTKVKKIMELNGIDDQNLIYVGQKLIVP